MEHSPVAPVLLHMPPGEETLQTMVQRLDRMQQQLTLLLTLVRNAEQRQWHHPGPSVPQEPGTVVSLCAWCRVQLGVRWSDSATVDPMSYGICPACATRVFDDAAP